MDTRRPTPPSSRPVTEFYGGIQALVVDHDAGVVSGAADDRRDGAWADAAVD